MWGSLCQPFFKYHNSSRVLGLATLDEVEHPLLLVRSLNAWEAESMARAIGRPIRFIYRAEDTEEHRLGWLGLDAIGIRSDAASTYRDWVAEAFARGMVVCLVSKGLKPAQIQSITLKSHASLIPVAIMGDRRLEWSRDHLPLEWSGGPDSRRIYLADAVETDQLDWELVQRRWLDLEARALDEHPMLKEHIGRACIEGLKKRQFREVLIDAAMDDRRWSGGMLLAVAWEMSAQVKRKCQGERVGLLLPPGTTGSILNLAVMLSGKIPVNFNFTIGPAAAESCFRQSGVSEVLTVKKLHDRLPDFPWPERCYDVAEWLRGMDKKRVLLKRLAVLILPPESLSEWIGVPIRGDHQEAGLLFTSGSSGDPKGVPLSHRNILSNLSQIGAVLPIEEVPNLLGHLPIFHSFGFTVMLWWPMVNGPQVVTYTSPLETGKLIEIIERHQLALLVTTPTFLRQLGRKAKPEQLKCLQMVVTGAEKLPPELLEEFEDKFKRPVCEGYGMTEATPVIAVNRLRNRANWTEGRRIGSVGPLLPGVSVRVVDPDTGRDLSLRETGVLKYRGANVFKGYLDRPDLTEPVLKEGWYYSGDMGHLEEDDFLVIEGRLSRFSKIGGEMVPHGTVEAHLLEIVQDYAGDEAGVVVTGVEDGSKGEQLVALFTVDYDQDHIRKEMLRRGLPTLWIPKRLQRVEAIPHLASGKLDLRAIRQMAEDPT
jgi:acyl-[acyl-carrier-protein]-phospholipid O-acyltransferase/long-chain-fatty-acid--[acyl-carrier-protein] ligase